MPPRQTELSPHCHKVLDLLTRSDKPLPAYNILGALRKFGIKAPPTVYRALDKLIQKGLVHRIESLNAFVACNESHDNGHSHKHSHPNTGFAVCRDCGTTVEIHDHRLCDVIEELSKKLKFHIEREMLELLGLCNTCHAKKESA